MKNQLATASNLIAILVVLPIWYWLLYQVLERVNASELMWFLYWVYLPAGVLSATLAKLVSAEK